MRANGSFFFRTVLLGWALASGAPRSAAQGPLWSEGPLGSDLVLVLDGAAQQALSAADGILARARIERGEEARRLTRQALEGWVAAIRSAEPGACVAWSECWPAGRAPGGSPAESGGAAPRASEGLEVALLRRVDALSPEEGALWSEQFEAVAAAEFERALRAQRPQVALAELERCLPGTRGALRAALCLADLALAHGARIEARTQAERAAAHARRLGDPQAAAAAKARLGALEAPDRPREPSDAPRPSLAPGRRLELGPAGTRFGGFGASRLGLLPGAALLAPDRLLVQGAQAMALIDPREPRLLAAFDPGRSVASACGAPSFPYPSPVDPPWRLRPAALAGAEAGLVAVLGRSRQGSPGNQIAGLSLPPTANFALEVPELPLRWVWCRGNLSPSPSADGPPSAPIPPVLAEAELGGSPLVCGERVLVSARRTEGEVEAWLLGLDALDGRARYARLLAQGSLRGADARRLSGSSAAALAQAPLWTQGGRALVDTGLGALALIDLADGRLHYCLRLRRPPDEQRGGFAGERCLALPPAAGQERGTWLVASADSDRLYRLPDGPLGLPAAPGASPLAPPLPQRGEIALLWSDGARALLLGNEGRRRILLELDLASGERRPALEFAPGERPSPLALAVPDQQVLLLASDVALYLFDLREAGARLLAAQPIERALGEVADLPAMAAEVLRVGRQVLVLEAESLFAFELL
jgi:hypothetical protein